MSKLSFSLAKPKKDVQPVGTAPSLTRVALDDDNESSVLSGGGNAQRKMDAELKVDSTVFQYDEVWDGMKLAEAKAKAQKEDNPEARKPKYMKNLLDSAATRRLDHLRAEEKLMQREREAEGDEFADKEKFVTQAYKDQMAEVRRAEAEEKAREGASSSASPLSFDSMWAQPDDTYIEAERKKNKGLGGGMTHFYKRMLEDSSRSHDAAVAATSSDPDPSSESAATAATSATSAPGRIGPAPVANLTVTRPARGPKPLEVAPNPDEVLKSGETRTNGETKTMITADGADAGLNLSAPNTRNLSLLRAIHGSGSKTTEEPVVAHRAAGVAASKEEIRKRQQRQLEAQLEEERKRVRDEQEREEREERERVVRRRNDESAVNDAKERYLARKRRKLEEEQQQEQQES
ncbi:nuclear speckle splicing regulatory protein 1 [Rhizoctonia solani]|uniref:Nuclear speckle splicing regulatory protein 1 n=1 Tax=Rhizoctonia solani TaxID=456999 RepID=A0A8H8T3Z8_9AGAM|nr:nuclear speckle splicing regulatory protein 1 [Rhizoctonia solani]QRW27624.1 nuclear speckle splicing regulatory protein 1 [Rhizoctonia solani]